MPNIKIDNIEPSSRCAFGVAARCGAPVGRASESHRIGHPVRMIFGSHVILLSRDADADRAFLAEVLGFEHVDAGGGWLIFGLPPAEAAIHPADAPGAELYFMCDDLVAEMESLAAKGVTCSDVEEARWGSVTKIRLPGGGEVGLYQPRHAAMVEQP
jgi:catechol 2,3-dioxygenase-like lactoylglutathione lyase family enzyme